METTSGVVHERSLDQRTVARAPFEIEIARFQEGEGDGFKALSAYVDVRARSIQFRAQAWAGGKATLDIKTATLTKAIHAYNQA